jgi:hypothetical protein
MAGEAQRAAFRAAALVGRRAAAAVGQRDTTVTLEVTAYDAAINVAGAVAGAPTITTLEPPPKVERAPGPAGYFGDGLATQAGGEMRADFFRLRHLTRRCPSGGLDPDELLVAATASRQVRFRLVGDDHPAAGTLCVAVAVEDETPQSFSLIVQRTTQT